MQTSKKQRLKLVASSFRQFCVGFDGRQLVKNNLTSLRGWMGAQGESASADGTLGGEVGAESTNADPTQVRFL